MDTSPIPSPAFSNVTQSTALTSASSIRSNMKMYLTDIKNVMLSRSCSFKVQRVKVLMMITSYEGVYEKLNRNSIFICDYLYQNPDPHAHHLATEITETFKPIHSEFKAYCARIHLALDAFNSLTKLEYRLHEIACEVERLTKDLDKSEPLQRQAFARAVQEKRAEYSDFKLNVMAMTDDICHQIFFELCDNIRKHMMLVRRGVISIRQALDQFPDLNDYLSLVKS